MGSIRRSDVIRIAKAECGYTEQENNWTKYSRDLDKVNYFVRCGSSQNKPWCATFTNWVMCKSSDSCEGGVGGEITSGAKWDSSNFQYQNSYCNKSRTTGFYADYFMADDHWSGTPEAGDICFINVNGSIGHVGIVVDVGKYITTVEGNAGDMVQEKYYDCSDIDYYNGKIAGFGKPYYDDEISGTNGKETENNGNNKTWDEIFTDIAWDCYEGKYGNGLDRKHKVNSLGYGNIFSEVQKRVNMIVAGLIKR